MDDAYFEDLYKFQEEFRSYGALSWRTCLGMAALLDLLATVLPRQLRNPDFETVDEFLLLSPDSNGMLLMPGEYEIFGHPIPELPFGAILRFLQENCGYIGFIFSILSFVEAFMDASRHRDRALMERDRQRLLRIKKDANEEDNINVIDDLGFLDDNIDSWMAFYFRLFLQLMFLPVGFYWLMSRGIFLEAQLQMNWEGHDNDDGDRELNDLFSDTYNVHGKGDSTTSSRSRNLSLGFSILREIVNMTLAFAYAKGLVAKKAIFKEVMHILRKAFGTAVRNPIRFAANVRMVLAVLRWLKYIQPIFGASNKLKGNLLDLTKKYRQRQRKLMMRKIRKRIVGEMSDEERRDHAARKIQSTYRGHRIRKTIRALNLLRGQKEVLAAIKLQAAFRATLQRARVRISRKTLEFKRLKLKSELALSQKKKNKELHRMTPMERRRLYELEEELLLETARLLSRRLLIKPNTKFSVTWKLLFCVSVLFEITGLICNPMLKKYKDDDTGGMLSVHKVLEGYVIPEPIANLPECNCHPDMPQNWKSKLVFAVQRKESVVCEPSPWYCNPPFSTTRTWYIRLAVFLIDEFLLLVGIVVYMDVFISFLTGEIDEDTGILAPKGFVKRWLLPGLVLQLLVNPKMASTSKSLWGVLHQLFDIGPVRVWRWTSAVFYPLFIVLFDFAERKVWAPFVHDQNHQSIMSQVKNTVVSKQVDLEDSLRKLAAMK